MFKGEMLYYTKWISAGIIYLHDIVIDNRFINLSELSKKIKCPTNVFKFQKFFSAIPDKWKRVEKNQTNKQNKTKNKKRLSSQEKKHVQ